MLSGGPPGAAVPGAPGADFPWRPEPLKPRCASRNPRWSGRACRPPFRAWARNPGSNAARVKLPQQLDGLTPVEGLRAWPWPAEPSIGRVGPPAVSAVCRVGFPLRRQMAAPSARGVGCPPAPGSGSAESRGACRPPRPAPRRASNRLRRALAASAVSAQAIGRHEHWQRQSFAAQAIGRAKRRLR